MRLAGPGRPLGDPGPLGFVVPGRAPHSSQKHLELRRATLSTGEYDQVHRVSVPTLTRAACEDHIPRELFSDDRPELRVRLIYEKGQALAHCTSSGEGFACKCGVGCESYVRGRARHALLARPSKPMSGNPTRVLASLRRHIRTRESHHMKIPEARALPTAPNNRSSVFGLMCNATHAGGNQSDRKSRGLNLLILSQNLCPRAGTR